MLPITDKSYEQIRTLDQILPPIVTRVNSSSGASNEGSPVSDYVAIVSRKLPRRQEMGELIETLDAQLEQRAARNEGFCPTRRQIFDDLFDEILRQVKWNRNLFTAKQPQGYEIEAKHSSSYSEWKSKLLGLESPSDSKLSNSNRFWVKNAIFDNIKSEKHKMAIAKLYSASFQL